MILADDVYQQQWYGNGAWLVSIMLVVLWLLYVAGKIRRRRK